jgi:hypothetical protein
VQPERDASLPRLPAASLPLLALGERDAHQPLPEPTSAIRVVRGKLDEKQLDHAAMVPLYRHGGGKGPAVTLVAVSGAPRGRRIMRSHRPAQELDLRRLEGGRRPPS